MSDPDFVPHTHYLPCLLGQRFQRLALRCHGAASLPPLVCVHGLTRNARDFDALAQRLADAFHVVAVDLPGRGASDWLSDPRAYDIATYVTALSHVFAWLARPVAFLGTSLGGICAMAIGAMPGQPITRMVLNDMGPVIPAESVRRIGEYLSAPPPLFPDLEAARLYLRRVHAPFGPLTDAQWRQMARDSTRPDPAGGLRLHYDPAIAIGFAEAGSGALDMRPWWEALTLPILVLRGETSDLLPAAMLTQMEAKATTRTIAGAGHAPALLDAESAAVIRGFLLC